MKPLEKLLPQLKPEREMLAASFIEGKGLDDEEAQRVGYIDAKDAKRALKSPTMRAHLSTYLDAAGATLEKSAQVISEAMGATEKKFFSFEGVVQDEREVVDHATRVSAAKLNLEARGELKQGLNVAFNMFGEVSDEELAKIAMGLSVPEHLLPSAGLETK